MKEESLLNLLALTLIENVGAVRIHRVLSRFTRAEAVFSLSDDEIIAEFNQIKGRKVTSINRDKCFRLASKVLEDSQKREISIITTEDTEYPFNLRHIENPPPVLYVRGNIAFLNRNAVALVGTRAATDESKRYAFDISAQLAEEGVWVISGLAKGVDTSAHWGALSANGNTAGVLGSGLDHIYPAENYSLYSKILEKGGLLVSEFYTGMKPERENFPRRNRIIAGLSLGTLVVQAGKRSGSMITASYALEQGREVYVGPHEETDVRFFGNRRLSKDGALTIHNASEILEDLENVVDLSEESINMKKQVAKDIKLERGAGIKKQKIAVDNIVENGITLTPTQQKIYDLIVGRIHIDDIASSSGVELSEAAAELMKMEIMGIVRQEAGKYYTKAGE